MRRTVTLSLGILLLAGGVGAGVLLQRSGVLDRQGAPDRPAAGPELAAEAMGVKRKARTARPSLEDDEQVLGGLWIQPRESGANPKILSFKKRTGPRECYVKVCDLGSLSPYAMFTIEFVLAEGGAGQREMLHTENLDGEGQPVVLFTYRLDGDTLELHRMVPANYGDNYDYDLGGKWRRLHHRQDAEPGAAPDRRGR